MSNKKRDKRIMIQLDDEMLEFYEKLTEEYHTKKISVYLRKVLHEYMIDCKKKGEEND